MTIGSVDVTLTAASLLSSPDKADNQSVHER